MIDEVAWEEPLTGWGPGGGLSVFNRRPAWQAGLGVDNDQSNGMRQVPDVAAAADPTAASSPSVPAKPARAAARAPPHRSGPG